MLKVENILKNLLKFPSITPNDAGCFDYLEALLKPFGFTIYRTIFPEKAPETTIDVPVENFYARLGKHGPHLLFAGHVDVVPPGDLALWTYPPFEPTIKENRIYGRGAVDMKGGIAAFIAALAQYLETQPLKGSISLALTADEEGPALYGTVKLLEKLAQKGQKWDAALVGEPSSDTSLGDSIKIGRRGSLSGKLTIKGQQGHVAYPHKCHNPLLAFISIMQKLMEETLDEGTAHFPPSNLEFTALHTDNKATNVIPDSIEAHFNIRYNDLWTHESLKHKIELIIQKALQIYGNKPKHYMPTKLSYQLEWQIMPIEAFLTNNDPLISSMTKAIAKITNLHAELSTKGGTSDARFIKNYCPVIEFGPCGTTMHQIDESIPLEELENLAKIYEKFLENYFR